MDYVIQRSAFGGSVYYHVFATIRVGFSRVSYGKPFYTASREADAEKWIKDTNFMDSDEGKAAEKARNDAIDQAWANEKAEMAANGFTLYLAAPHQYMNPTTREIRSATAPFGGH